MQSSKPRERLRSRAAALPARPAGRGCTEQVWLLPPPRAGPSGHRRRGFSRPPRFSGVWDPAPCQSFPRYITETSVMERALNYAAGVVGFLKLLVCMPRVALLLWSGEKGCWVGKGISSISFHKVPRGSQARKLRRHPQSLLFAWRSSWRKHFVPV